MGWVGIGPRAVAKSGTAGCAGPWVCEIVIDARGGCSKSRRSLRNGRLVLIPGATDISVASSVAQKQRHNVGETSVHT